MRSHGGDEVCNLCDDLANGTRRRLPRLVADGDVSSHIGLHNGSAEHGISYQADARRWFESGSKTSAACIGSVSNSVSIIAQFVRR